MGMLKEQRIVITGASSGIGSEMARQLSKRGAFVVLAARNQDKLEQVGAGLSGPFGLVRLDVSSEESVAEAFQRINDTYGSVDCLINNAGFGRFKPFTETPMNEFESMMDVNYMGVVRCTKAVLPGMLAAGKGHIVNIASIAGKLGTAKSSAYSASKHAVLGFTNALRQELRGTGVTLSAVNPGPIDTPFFTEADPDGSYVKNVGWFMMKPEKVAKAVVQVIERKKTEVDLPWAAGIGTKLYQLFPRLADKLAGGVINKK
ncbi:SDR family NAD(P)-dependent oxidoreductase [Paenibacillus physcomitrellae]|uniref:Oxidoreductase n=1 Tax=Paenibacillus physcomitrellae TaxID=1619311 RepID=A0ABQ1G1Q2_9BACL|nr:SDR family oxidoreductase [Paenibacillus physcomitrellae]GGA35657.1 oxidoreductase [Paenibacillus physcomitrellae]